MTVQELIRRLVDQPMTATVQVEVERIWANNDEVVVLRDVDTVLAPVPQNNDAAVILLK